MADQGNRDEAVSAPAGTGNAPGLGEAFTLDLNTGQGGYAIPLPLPDGIAGFTPRLKLEYHHGASPGPFGVGWALPVRTIERRLDFGVPGEGVAERFMDGGQDLLDMGGGEYRAQVESAFTRWSRDGDGWKVQERTGIEHRLGTQAGARVADPAHPDRVVTWLLERSTDLSGNEIAYDWTVDEGCPYLDAVRYGPYTVRLAYEPRPDVRRNARAGFVRTLARRCTEVALHVEVAGADRVARRWALGYAEAPFSGLSQLASVQLTSVGPGPDGSGDVVRPPQRLTYSAPDPASWHAAYVPALEDAPPPGLDGADVVLAPLGAGPLPGVLQASGGELVFWPVDGEDGFGAPRRVGAAPIIHGLAADGVQLLDLDGDARVDVLVGATAGAGVTGFFRGDPGGGVGDFVAYPRSRRAVPTRAGAPARVADVDGDGRVDVLTTAARGLAWWRSEGGDGFADPVLPGAVAPGPDGEEPDLFDPLVRTADMTGDGLADLVRIRSGGIVYWPNLGNGRFGAPVLMTASPRLPALAEPDSVLLLDADGDGCADLVRVAGDGVTVWPNRSGAAFGAAIHDPLVPPPIPGTVAPALLRDDAPAGVAWCARRNGRTAYVSYAFGPTAYLLTGVDNGAGLHSTIAYSTAAAMARADRLDGRPWARQLPFPVTVVAGTREADATTAQVAESRYRYHDGHFDDRTRTFEGFALVEKTEVGDASRADVRTVFHYRVGEDRAPGADRSAAALNRALARVEVLSPDSELPYTVEETDHAVSVLGTAVDGRRRVWVTATRTARRTQERGADERIEERTFAFDADGNVREEVRRQGGTRAGAPVPDVIVTTEVAYATDPARNLIDRPARITRRDGAGALMMEIHRHYDGPDHVGLPLGEIGRGLLTRELRWVAKLAGFGAHYAGMDRHALGYADATDADGDAAVFAPTERHAYDAAGRRVSKMSPTGAVTTYGYDATGLFRRTATSTLGTTTTETDPVVGQPTGITEDDGSNVRMSYDAQGRLTRVTLPGDTDALPTRAYAYDDASQPNAVRIAMRLQPGAPQTCDTAVYFDGRGRECQRRVTMDAGRVVVSGHVVRNPWGDAAEEYEPEFAAGLAYAAPATAGRPARTFRYDGLGRPVRTVDYGGGVSTATYRPFESETVDAVGAHRIDRTDAAQHRTETVEPGGVTSTFSADALGRLLAHGDAFGEVARSTFDGLGNRLTLVHREAGQRRCFYDAGARMVRLVDGAGHDIAATFDDQDRIVALTVDGTPREAYEYDDLASGGFGRLHRVRYPGGSQSFAYDAQGRVVEHAHHFDGVAAAQTLRFAYDAQGRRTSVTYPDGTVVAQEYYANGVPRRVPGFVDAVEYDPRMLPSRVAYANGIVTEVSYTPGPGRVASQRTVGTGGTVIDEQVYDYDAQSRVRSLTTPDGDVDFAYDPLSQLAEVTDARGGAPQTVAYGYAAGRLIAANGETGTTLHRDDPAHPARPSRITRAGADTAVTYDGNGNLVTLPGRTLAFGPKNELEDVTTADGATVHYGYDHAGRRVRKQVSRGGASVDTLMLGALAEVRDGTLVAYVVMGSSRIALLRGGATTWIHTDPLGSATFYSDASGTPIARIAYAAFGNLRSRSGQPPAQVFALHELDTDAGLYYTRRRWYAPDLGLFVSPDGVYLHRPERGLDEPASLSLYAYVANDPANRVDPDGGSFWTVLGGIVGVIVAVVVAVVVVAAFASGIGFGLLALAGLVLAVTGGYLLASANQGTAFGDFMKGMLIGLNAGLNAIIATALFGPVVGLVLGVIGFLAVFDAVRQNSFYQGVLGWSSWLMPMSWLVQALGLLFFLLNVIPAIFTGNQVDAVKITYIHIDWATGSIIMKGGWISNLNSFDTAFDMGNFVYVDAANTAPDDDVPHELGHALSLGAFGSIVHLVGFVDEMGFGGGNAWTERMADSHSSRRRAEIAATGATPDDTWG